MSEALTKVAELGIPTTSYISAIQYLRDHPLQTNTYAAQYEGITGTPLQYSTDNEARIKFSYLIQELLRNPTLSLVDVTELAASNAAVFLQNNPWSAKSYASEEPLANPVSADDITPAPLKGKRTKVAGRKEQAFAIYKANDGKSKAEILALFVAAGMSPAGAQTYFYQCKKELGFHGKSERKHGKRRGENKKAKALELYASLNDGRSQDAIIAEFEKVLATSHAGATTYFYACKAAAGFAGKSERKRRGNKTAGRKTKMEIAIEIFNANPGADKATVIGLIADACSTTPAGAQTFYYAAKRAGG